MTLTLSGDHGVWDGRAAARFLAAVQGELER
jgi:pyruvate/2-oxoglutarate dehydrogenase complex dihydrolipoamide acyltransferase (E2) component